VAVDLSADPTFPDLVTVVRGELSTETAAPGAFPVRCDGERDADSEPPGPSPVELALSWTRGSTGLTLTLDYATDLFDRSTAAAMLTDLRRLLAGLVAHPDLPTQEAAMEYVHQDDTGFDQEAVR
jgi:non-ribosomal peptide synthetase component F